MNYVCYSLPLADSSMLLTKRWVELRDSVMKRNIPGSTPENWMTTTRENGEPLVVQRSVQLADGRQVYEMRGLWEMRKGRSAVLSCRWHIPTLRRGVCW